MTIIVDTSVVVKWFIDEPGREASRQILKSNRDLVAPDFMIAEVANVLWRRQRAGDIGAVQLDEALTAFPKFFKHLVPSPDLVLSALQMARKIGHSVYDCMFLALAAQMPGASLVTADDRFISKVLSTRHESLLRQLTDFAPSTGP